MLRTATLATSLMLICALLITGPSLLMGPTLAQNEESADLERNFEPSPTWACGDLVTVRLEIDWDPEPEGSNTGLSVEESVPSGWTVAGTTAGGSTGTPGQVKWFISDPAVEVLTYDLEVPSDAAGSFSFHGEYRDPSLGQGDANKVIQGSASASVSCADPEDPDGGDETSDPAEGESQVTRTMADMVRCGEAMFQVSLDLSWGGASNLFIEEELPLGWQAADPSHGGDVGGDARTVKWWLDDSAITAVDYQVKVPDDAEGSFSFMGEFRDDSMGQDEANHAIDGVEQVSVDCPDLDPAQVERGLPVQGDCSQVVQVTLLITPNDATTLTVTERVPGTDWTIQENGGGVEGPQGTLVWTFDEEDLPWQDLTYSVLVPADAEGTFAFQGSGEDDTGADEVTGGDQQLQVECPDPGRTTRSIPPVCSGTFRVHLSVQPDAADAWFVDETPPAGLEFQGASGDGAFDPETGQIKWVDTGGGAAELWYDLVVPDSAQEGTQYDWSGEFRFDPTMDGRATIDGDDSVVSDCSFIHAYDQDQDCVFGDNDLFALIDAWKGEEQAATDNVLFVGIVHWKQSPASYCGEAS